MALFKIEDKHKPVVKVIAIFVIFLSISSMFLTNCHRTPKINLKMYQALGFGMADETIKQLNKQGQIVVVSLDGGPTKIKPFQVMMEWFYSTLKKQSSITVLYDEKVSPMATSYPGMGTGMESKLYLKLLEQYPKASAFVSFMGPPRLTEEEWNKVPTDAPKLIVFSMTDHGLKRQFEEQLVTKVITRNYPQPTGKPGRKMPDAFKFYYKVVTESPD